MEGGGGRKLPPPNETLLHLFVPFQGPLGQYLWLTFKLLPPPSASDYHASVKRPIDMQTIDTKFSQGSYHTVNQLLDDVSLLCDNAYGYYPKESRQAKVRG